MLTTIKSVYTGLSNSALALPYAIARFACGHGVAMEYRDRSANRHDPANWLLQVGAAAECADCDRNGEKLQRILEFVQTPEYSHTTLRDLTASKTGEWMAFCVYRIDRSSPTQCVLAMSVEATPETDRALCAAGVKFVPGPSRGSIWCKGEGKL